MDTDLWRTRVLAPATSAYPPSLASFTLADPDPGEPPRPPPLFVRGRLPEARLVAVVGTRDPEPSSVAWTRRLVCDLAAAGVAIGSGGARGIDEVAHRAAIAAGTPTLAVVVGGLDLAWAGPGGELLASIVGSGGAAMSLEADGAPVERGGFFRRNELLVALSAGVVAVELRPKPGQGGTGHTVRAALRRGRPAFTVGHAPWSPGGPGAAAISRLGVPLVLGAGDVVELLGSHGSDALPSSRASPRRRRRSRMGSTMSPVVLPPAEVPHAPAEPSPLPPDTAAALAALEDGPTSLEVVCAATGFDAGRALRALLEGALSGVLMEITPGRYLRAAPLVRAATRGRP